MTKIIIGSALALAFVAGAAIAQPPAAPAPEPPQQTSDPWASVPCSRDGNIVVTGVGIRCKNPILDAETSVESSPAGLITKFKNAYWARTVCGAASGKYNTVEGKNICLNPKAPLSDFPYADPAPTVVLQHDVDPTCIVNGRIADRCLNHQEPSPEKRDTLEVDAKQNDAAKAIEKAAIVANLAAVCAPQEVARLVERMEQMAKNPPIVVNNNPNSLTRLINPNSLTRLIPLRFGTCTSSQGRCVVLNEKDGSEDKHMGCTVTGPNIPTQPFDPRQQLPPP